MNRTSPPLRLDALELRVVPALQVLFDFRFDDTGFFTEHIDRVNVLRLAASDVTSQLRDELAAIPFPTAGNSWKARFDRPSGVGQAEEITNLPVPANAIIVFVGARDVGIDDGGLIDASTGREATGSADWQQAVGGRGQSNAF